MLYLLILCKLIAVSTYSLVYIYTFDHSMRSEEIHNMVWEQPCNFQVFWTLDQRLYLLIKSRSIGRYLINFLLHQPLLQDNHNVICHVHTCYIIELILLCELVLKLCMAQHYSAIRSVYVLLIGRKTVFIV